MESIHPLLAPARGGVDQQATRRTDDGSGSTLTKGRLNCSLGVTPFLKVTDGEEALEIGKDFMQSDERQVLISQRGIARVARDMRANSRITKTRQAWIEAVGEVVETCFKSEIRHLTDGVDRAKKRAKAAASHRCEITGESSKAYRKIDLDGHHLFDRHSRPDLADLPENILVLVPELHREFHIWKSGPCTPKDVLVFIETVRADLFDPVNSRHMKRLRTLTHRLQRLQSEREGQRVRYHRS